MFFPNEVAVAAIATELSTNIKEKQDKDKEIPIIRKWYRNEIIL